MGPRDLEMDLFEEFETEVYAVEEDPYMYYRDDDFADDYDYMEDDRLDDSEI